MFDYRARADILYLNGWKEITFGMYCAQEKRKMAIAR
jgi:hypothetical protein